MDADAMIHQEHYKLVPVHQGDGGFVYLGGLLDGSWAEVAFGDDQALLLRPQAATHLLHDRSPDVVLDLPFLDLDGHLDSDHIAHHQSAWTSMPPSPLSLVTSTISNPISASNCE